MLLLFQGHSTIDTARMYNHGATEEMLGALRSKNPHLRALRIDSKANAFKDYNKDLSPANVLRQSESTLGALKEEAVNVFYLHAPDHNTPIEETLEAVQQLYAAGKFKYFGLSNYAAWQVVLIWSLCREKGYVLPTVYQGMYNAITRNVEEELFPALRKCGMSKLTYTVSSPSPRSLRSLFMIQ